MALTGVHDAVAFYNVQAGGCCITLSCPPFFGDLLLVTLTGWQVQPADKINYPDITIVKESKGFRILSARFDTDVRYSDLVDVLNVLYIALVRLYALSKPNKTLLHCAAFITPEAVTTLAIGPKKMGKSFLTWQTACRGGTVLSDDILLWDQQAAQFECLGLPIRLRRPVHWDGKLEDLKKGIIAGKRLAYTVNSFMPIAPVGHVFCPDEILLAEEIGVFRPVPLAKIWPLLLGSRIA